MGEVNSTKATEAAKNAGPAKNIEAVHTEASTTTEAAKAAAQDQLPTLELQPDKDGRPLELSARQQRLIQLQHSGASRVVVKKLHGGFSGSLVLQTTAYDERGEPKEPAVSKLDAERPPSGRRRQDRRHQPHHTGRASGRTG